MGRTYDSEVRRRGKAQTRESIVDALVGLVLDEGVHAFTMQNVAKRAGVSMRTVYRHFESREQLLEALCDFTDDVMDELFGTATPSDIEAVPATLARLFTLFGEAGDPLRAAVVTSIAMGHRTARHEDRQKVVLRLIRQAYPNLGARQQREAAAVLRVLSGTRGWFIMTGEAQLKSREAGEATAWAVDALLRDLKARNDAADK